MKDQEFLVHVNLEFGNKVETIAKMSYEELAIRLPHIDIAQTYVKAAALPYMVRNARGRIAKKKVALSRHQQIGYSR
jgi:hypothetical protein